MKVLITGGAGFLGSHLADRLLAEGNEVLVLDNYETGRRENLTDQEGLTVVEGTIADRAEVDKAFKDFNPDVVAHAACSYTDGEAWEHDVMTNAMGTVNVVRASQEADVDRIIYFQTGLSYGIRPSEQPVTAQITPSPASRATRSPRPPARATSRCPGSTASRSASPTSTGRATSRARRPPSTSA